MGRWKNRRTTLEPCSTDPTFQPLVFEEGSGELRVIAELVKVL